LNNPSR